MQNGLKPICTQYNRRRLNHYFKLHETYINKLLTEPNTSN